MAVQFNTSSSCVAPLLSRVADSDSWYEETECGLQCRDPLFTKAELDRVSVFIFVLGTRWRVVPAVAEGDTSERILSGERHRD
jgi:hypothetical protein